MTMSWPWLMDSVRAAAAEGLYLEPTGAVSLAGARGIIDEGADGDGLVLVTTGHGLKHVSDESQNIDSAYTPEAWV